MTLRNHIARGFAFLMLTAAAVPASAAEPQMAPPESDKMVSLFNGKDLTGWDGDTRLWSVKDGVIHGETTDDVKANRNTFLIWQDGNTKNFELRLSFRATASNNSGIQYRSKHITEGENLGNKWILRGYQHEIRNEEDLPNVSGFIYDEGGKRGRVCLVGERTVWEADGKQVKRDNLIDAAAFKELMKVDDWNEVVIIARGNRIRHFLNGRLTMDFTDNHPELALSDGSLGLQLHAGKPMWAEFKDIRFRELKMKKKKAE